MELGPLTFGVFMSLNGGVFYLVMAIADEVLR
jgi:hypothetical protein